jgi:tetratricopeptide (TPR) repeat protein
VGVGRLWILLCLLAASAGAQPDEARGHFDRGRELYDQGLFREAMSEFVEARTLMAAPAFDYNIGRCLEQLGQWGEAADAYGRYLPAAGEGEVPVLRALIANLRQRQREAALRPAPIVTPTTTALPPPVAKPIYKRGWFWGVLGGTVAAAALGVALGVTLGTRPDPYHSIMGVQF